MKTKLKTLIKKIRKNKFVRIPLGILFMIIGLVGIILPILPGWIFLLLGISIFFGPHVIEGLIKKFEIKKKKK